MTDEVSFGLCRSSREHQGAPLWVCFFTVCISVWYLLIRLARFLQAKMYRFAGAQSTFPIKGRQGLDRSLRLRTEVRFNLYAVGDDGLLRFGHAAALTAHRAVIHYRAAASLPRRPVSFSICLSSRDAEGVVPYSV